MSKLSFDSKVNSSEFIEKTEQIRSAIRDTAQEMEEQGQKISVSFQQLADNASASANVVENAIKNMQEQINASISSLSQLDAENQARMINLQKTGGDQTNASQNESIGTEMSSRENLSADINNQYKELAQLDAEISNYQQKMATNQNSIFEGVASGLNGLSGAFSAATSMLELFSVENESLRGIMAKVQTAIALTNGLQEVNTALSKESAFQLNVVGQLKLWWRNITLQVAAAQGVETAAASAGTVVNWSLAASFHAIGLAIKSIPVIGWILAGISALVGVYSLWTSGTEEQTEAQNEQNKSIKEFNEGIQNYAAKPVAMIEMLSMKFKALGNDIDAQKKFIVDNKNAFDELGVSINSVKDAQQLLIDNKGKFVEAQIAKAVSLVYAEKMQEEAKKYVEASYAAGVWGKVGEKKDKESTVMVNGIPVRGGKQPANEKESEMMKAQGMLSDDGNILRYDEVLKKDYLKRADTSYSNMIRLGQMSLAESNKSNDIMGGLGQNKKTPVPKKDDNAKQQAEEAHKKHMELLAQQESERIRFAAKDSQSHTRLQKKKYSLTSFSFEHDVI